MSIAETLRRHGSSVVADSLRDLGHRNRTAGPGLVPVVRAHSAAGPARTARFEVVPPGSGDFLPLARFIDSCEPGEVLVLAGAPGASPGSIWGEICTTAAAARGAAGVVMDGYMRDELAIGEMELPVFSRGAFAQDCLGRQMVTAVNVDVVCGGVQVSPGDLIVADADGVVVVPAALAGEVAAAAEAKRRTEEKLLAEVGAGRSLAEAVERLGVL